MLKGLKLFIVDDNDTFREGLRYILENKFEALVIGEAATGQEFLDADKFAEGDVVIMDIEMPIMNGVEATKKAINMCRDVKVIALTMYEDQNYVMEMIQAGVKGILFKDSCMDEIEEAVRKVSKGDFYFSKNIHHVINDRKSGCNENNREDI